MIKIAKNLQRMIAKQAAAADQINFTNESSDPMRPAFAAPGQLPQSYESDEAMDKDLSDQFTGRDLDERYNSIITPEQYAKMVNTSVGLQNTGLMGTPERVFTHGAYGPSRVSQNGRSQFSPYGFGDLYNMSPNEIERSTRTNMLY